MTVFYRGRRARITHEVIEAWCPERRSYRIRELHSASVVQPRRGVGQPATRLFAAGSVAILFVLVPMLNRTSAWLAGLALVLTVLIGGACLRVTPDEPYELWALRDDQPVLVFRSTDLREFGQVSRALCRALEQDRDAHL